MKSVFLTIWLIAMCLFSFAQKSGYKELQIGKSIEVVFEKKYLFKGLKTNANGDYIEYIVSSPTFKICDVPVEYVVLNLDDSGIIQMVRLVTKEFNVPNFSALLTGFKKVIDCTSESVGAPQTSITNPKLGESMCMGWYFKEEGIDFIVFEETMSSFDTNQSRKYGFTWGKRNKMW